MIRLDSRRQAAALLTTACVLLLIAAIAPSFYSWSNLRDIALANLPLLLIAGGMTLVIVVGQIDLSVGSAFAVCAVCIGDLAHAGVPAPLLPIVAIMIGASLGAVNGALVSMLRAPSIVVTLATMVAWRQMLYLVTGGAWVAHLPAHFQWFGLGQTGGETLLFLCAVAVFAALVWSSGHLAAFRWLYATGSDTNAARLSGIPTDGVVFFAFVLLGALTGLSSALNAARFTEIPANAGIGLELQAIAAVVIGGAPITGGHGRLTGTLCGVVLLSAIGPALTYIGLSASWERAIQGAIILAAVLIDVVAGRAERRRALAR
jgi:rhamnose transport system permease protein